MKFEIKSIILWPKKAYLEYRKIDFVPGKINMVTGASRTGKSAIIPIVDYCLGSDKCTIPVDIIRDACSWFGVLFSLDNEEILLCRKEPGKNKSTGSMHFIRGVNIAIPLTIEGTGNDNQESVKIKLNELFSMSSLELDANSGFASRPSYRDLGAFLFQPQNIIANADVLFYKADTMEHRQKLIQIFPYALGAITSEILFKKQLLERLSKQLEQLQRDFTNITNVSEKWKSEVKSWLMTAYEYGLSDVKPNNSNDDFAFQVQLLKEISEKSIYDSKILSNNLMNSSNELIGLKQEEQKIASLLFASQSRYEQMKQLTSSIEQYNQSLEIQIERLSVSKWLEKMIDREKTCPLCGNNFGEGIIHVHKFSETLAELESTAGDFETIPAAFDRELRNVENEIGDYTEKLRAIKKRIVIQSNDASSSTDKKYTIEGISHFLGRIQVTVQTYESLGTDSELQQKILELREQIKQLRKDVNQSEIDNKVKLALQRIQIYAQKLIATLDVERPDDPIEFVLKDLTIKIINSNGRDDYLWEIGSGSNWLSYHIALICAFQWYFQQNDSVKVPNFIFIDQPSQVYFPQKSTRTLAETKSAQHELPDEDKIAVKKIFDTLNVFLSNVPDMQIIVMEHADSDVWGEVKNIHLVKRWREGTEKLIPQEWI